jgi:TPR repeat protein
MGKRYEAGKGVKKDDIEAYAFYRLAESNDEEAKKSLRKLTKSMTKEELDKGKKRYVELQAEVSKNMKSLRDYDKDEFQKYGYYSKSLMN